MSAETGDKVSRIYGNFRGVDFRGNEVNLARSPDSLNVWKDYKNTDSIRTRPGARVYMTFTEKVYGIFFYDNTTLVHSGTKLYKISHETVTEIYTGLAESQSNAFIFENTWYFKDGKHYLQYDGNAVTDVVGYIPTTSIARAPEGGGNKYENVNMLSEYRKNTFLGDGTSYEYYLDVMRIDDDYTPIITVDDEPVTDFTVNHEAGVITFSAPPPKPLTDGRDNVVVQFKKAVEGYKENILNCTILTVFDNRVFFSGNKEHPNTFWHCSLNDPSYCSDLDYYREGVDDAAIKGMVAGNNALWVFREPSESNTNVFYHIPTTAEQYGKIYPSSHSSVSLGCVGKAINFNDDIVFFSQKGMEGISGDITTEQMAGHRSTLVDSKLISDNEYKDMLLEEWEGYLLVFVGKKVFLADSRKMFTNENHIEYEYYYWELEKKVTSVKVHNGTLYIGTDDGVYTLDDYGANVESYWVTPLDKFSAPNKLKTTNKRGCVVEAEGDISVYAKTEDTPFELVGEYKDIKDFFVSRIKRKKFKDIQLKFHSNTRFSLETATLECYIGGYIKR